METQLKFNYCDPAAAGQTTHLIRLGFGPEESNHLSEAWFTELRLDGTLEAWFEQLNLMAMWLVLSSRGLRAAGTAPGAFTIEPVGEPGPGQVLRVQASLRQYADFQALSLALIPHLTFEGGRYL